MRVLTIADIAIFSIIKTALPKPHTYNDRRFTFRTFLERR
ncbi:hypothetical protein ACPOL_3996 [Acidisarcina polymorpha]|uniref:Uncharacterized protein n=1 Tax=Acidisarcina polymorpha TaxID=2211140 RepID=A0A2Z5G3R9_9BACT|nr:hypothetical protein ACPOL_3996 [Acidisarcina polymorpha]